MIYNTIIVNEIFFNDSLIKLFQNNNFKIRKSKNISSVLIYLHFIGYYN